METALDEERKHLRPLPSSAVPGYTSVPSKVRKWSTIRVGRKTYSVPSRLIGHDVVARLHPEIVEVYFGAELVLTMPRLHGERDHRIVLLRNVPQPRRAGRGRIPHEPPL